jgi:DNA-binding transcriptional LysR family regulator
LLKREADLAVRVTPRPTQANLITRKLADFGWALYASRDYLQRRPLASGLAAHALVGFDDEMQSIGPSRWMDANLPRARVLRTNSILGLRAALLGGFGVGPLPCFVGDETSELLRVAPAVIASAEAWLVVHPELARVPRVRAVMDFLVERFAREQSRFAGQLT